MSSQTLRYIAIAFLLVAFVGGKIFLLFSRKHAWYVLLLGAVILIFSESIAAGTSVPGQGDIK
jgi:hypothetical protein